MKGSYSFKIKSQMKCNYIVIDARSQMRSFNSQKNPEANQMVKREPSVSMWSKASTSKIASSKHNFRPILGVHNSRMHLT